MIFPVFIALYGLAHVFIWYAVVSGVRLAFWAEGLLGLALFALGVTPFLARRLERRGHAHLARVFAWVGYTWAGLVLLFVLARFGTDLLMAAAAVLGFSAPYGLERSLPLIVTGVFTTALGVYSFVERSRVRVESIDVPTAKAMDGPSFLRIAQISDVHIGSMNGRRRIRTVVRRLQEIRPDAVVSTGDLIDSRAGLAVPVTGLLAAVQPPLGKFAVIGNHECYAGLDSSLGFMERAGFTVLRNQAISLGGIRLVGMDDPAAGGAAELASRESQLLCGLPDGVFTILLKHRPDLVPGSQTRFDLQLSGHTHKGQMFPFGFLTRLYYPAHAGLFRVAQASYLYVSRGTGAWGPPFRLLAPPEITVFTIGPGCLDPGGQPVPQNREDAAAAASPLPASLAVYAAAPPRPTSRPGPTARRTRNHAPPAGPA